MRLLILASMALICTSAAAQQNAQQKGGGTLSVENGRYVFGQVSDSKADKYMLDTRTGRLWTIVLRPHVGSDGKPIPGSQGYEVFSVVPYVLPDGTLRASPE